MIRPFFSNPLFAHLCLCVGWGSLSAVDCDELVAVPAVGSVFIGERAMRAVTLVRACIVSMFLASLGVAGTTVVLRTAETFVAQTELDKFLPTAGGEGMQDVQAD